MFKSGDVVLAKLQFTDTFEVKTRPALVLFEDHNNIVVAGITSNTEMEGISLTKKDGAVVDSVIKLNYIFTISTVMVSKFLFHLNSEKKNKVYQGLIKNISGLKN